VATVIHYPPFTPILAHLACAEPRANERILAFHVAFQDIDMAQFQAAR
jgi:hypothetical protein